VVRELPFLAWIAARRDEMLQATAARNAMRVEARKQELRLNGTCQHDGTWIIELDEASGGVRAQCGECGAASDDEGRYYNSQAEACDAVRGKRSLSPMADRSTTRPPGTS